MTFYSPDKDAGTPPDWPDESYHPDKDAPESQDDNAEIGVTFDDYTLVEDELYDESGLPVDDEGFLIINNTDDIMIVEPPVTQVITPPNYRTQAIHTNCGIVNPVAPDVLPTLLRDPSIVKTLFCPHCNIWAELKWFMWPEDGRPLNESIPQDEKPAPPQIRIINDNNPDYHIHFTFRGGGGVENTLVKADDITRAVNEITQKYGGNILSICITKFEQ